MARAVYWVELQEAIQKGKIRENLKYDLLEVWEPIQFPVRWKQKSKKKNEGGIVYWREYIGLVAYNPGDVLHPLWRATSEWENEEWGSFSEERLKELGAFRKNGQFTVQIVSKIKDLPAAVRQQIRHIPASLIERERKKFVLAGNARLLGEFALRLNNLVNEFLKAEKAKSELIEKSSAEFAKTYQALERGRSSLKRKAREDIQLALQGEFWEIAARGAQVSTDLLNQRVKDYEVAFKSVELGEKWLGLMLDIEKKFRNCYNRLGQLGMKLEELLKGGSTIRPAQLLPVANEAYGIWAYLNREIHFNPYCQRLQEYRFQRLSRVKDHAGAGRATTVLNDIKEATARLEAIAIGEKVTRAELRKEKETLF